MIVRGKESLGPCHKRKNIRLDSCSDNTEHELFIAGMQDIGVLEEKNMPCFVLVATQCPNGYEAIAENLEGTDAEWPQTRMWQTLQDCADTCDDRGGCTGFEYYTTGYRQCGFYTGGDTNIREDEGRDLSISERYSCIKGKCLKEA